MDSTPVPLKISSIKAPGQNLVLDQEGQAGTGVSRVNMSVISYSTSVLSTM